MLYKTFVYWTRLVFYSFSIVVQCQFNGDGLSPFPARFKDFLRTGIARLPDLN